MSFQVFQAAVGFCGGATLQKVSVSGFVQLLMHEWL